MLSHLNAPYFHNEEAARAVVEVHLWPDGPVCPFCGERERIGELKGKTTRAGLRKCYEIGTVLQESNIPYRYFIEAAIEAGVNETSSEIFKGAFEKVVRPIERQPRKPNPRKGTRRGVRDRARPPLKK